MVLADDHDAYREGLARVLRDDLRFELVAVVSTGVEAVDACRRLNPHLAVLDVRMPGIDGITVCERVSDGTRVVLLTDSPTEILRARATEAGASALLDKSAARVELCDEFAKQNYDVL